MSRNGAKPKERAAELLQSGRTYKEAAAELGVATTTVYRWLNPEYEERSRRLNREAKQRRKNPCPECGRKVSYEYPDGELCVECKHEAEYGERNRRLVEMWEAGVPTRIIASQLGMTETAVHSDIVSWRQRGQPLTLRRRRNRELWPAIQRRWNEGATSYEIADELGTTFANVLMMAQAMRKAGIDLPWRGGGNKHDPERARHVEKLWRDGLTLHEIGAELGLTKSGTGSYIFLLRQRGYDLPYRRKVAA